MAKRSGTFATVEVIVATAMWAMSFIFIKVALRELSPITLITLRFGIGALVAGGIVWWRNGIQVKKSDVIGLMVLGFVGTTLHQTVQVMGQRTTTAGMASLCAATAPAMLVIMAGVFLRERPGKWQIAGVMMALLGAGIVTTSSSGISSIKQVMNVDKGSLLVLLSSVVWAISAIICKKLIHKRPSSLITSGSLVFGWLFTLPFFVMQAGWKELPGLSVIGWASIIALGVFCTAATNLLNNHAFKKLSAQRMAVIYNLEPIIAVTAAWVLLGERISWMMLVGGALVILGVYLSEVFGSSSDSPIGDQPVSS